MQIPRLNHSPTRHSNFIRHSSLVIRHSFLALLLLFSPRASASPPTTQPTFQCLAISHIALYSHDLTRSRAFYKNYLGLQEPYSLIDPAQPATTTQPAIPENLHLTWIKINDRQTIELFPEKSPDAPRTYHMAIEVENIEALRAHLASQNIKVPPTVPKGRIGNLNFTIPDPAGHLVEFVQYDPAGKTLLDAGKHLPRSVPLRISMLTIPVPSLDKLPDFYEKTLHLPLASASTDGQRFIALAYKLSAGDTLRFILAPKSATSQELQTTITLSTEKFPTLATWLQSHALPNFNPPSSFTERKITTTDPDNTLLDITPLSN